MSRKALRWEIAARRHRIKTLPEGRMKRQLEAAEHRKASMRARVEHPFRVIKRKFGFVKVRFKGLAKNTAQIVTLFALANLWLVRKELIALAGRLRPQYGM